MTYFVIYRISGANSYFWVNLSFIFIVSLHLICLSGVSLVTGRTLKDTFEEPVLWLVVMTLTLAAVNLLQLLCVRSGLYEKIRMVSSDVKRLRRFIQFECYAVFYLLFDSIPCIFPLAYEILSVFLIGSCILLLLQILLFIIYTGKIIEKAHYEAEYYRLEEVRAEKIKQEMVLRKLAYYDSLTGAYTRRYAMEILESVQKDKRQVVVAYIDINGLKAVNDTLGHLEGDQYLMLVANSLNSGLYKNDVLARIGGDEFLIISIGRSKHYLKKLLNTINKELAGRKTEKFTPSFSFGIAEASAGESLDINELIRKSDSLMYSCKIKQKRGDI